MFNLFPSLYNFILCPVVLESAVKVKKQFQGMPENPFRILYVSIKSLCNRQAYKD